ncbi:uncharacterized protein LOC109601911 [Aethina tumida]|uniref:uncharacterized protein LOC109601911 n=1 Tax=Aethina tumida TaxID=116153 RepID=UPI00096B3358|nr:uncharacterized protein LOC109601911 [Aethina tumida]
MEGAKLEISGGKKSGNNSPTATYKALTEKDMEEDTVARPKSLVKVKTESPEADGADEKMLPKEDAKLTTNSNVEIGNVKVSSPNEKQNGDAKLDIGDLKPAFVGLTKEELMKYANDPFWVRLRMFLFVTFWILWAAMLVGAVLIIYAAPKCPAPEPRPWWEQGPLTEVPSDINLETLKSEKLAGFKGFILPWTEDTYSNTISDTHQIVKLLQAAKANDTKIIVEVDPSTSQSWFEQSESKDPVFDNYYIWKKPKDGSAEDKPEPPNNWKKVHTNESSWVYSSKRKEFYYAPLSKPLLNFRNQNVTNEFVKVIKLFADKGAAGFVLKNVAWLLADTKFEDEAINNNPKLGNFGMMDYDFYTHTKTENLPELGSLLGKWRKAVKNLTLSGPFMVKEELHNVNSYRDEKQSLMVDLPVQGHVLSKQSINVSDLVNSLNISFNADNVAWPLWKVNATAVPTDAMHLVTYLLPGVPLIPYTDGVNAELTKLRDTSKSIMWGNTTYWAVANKTVFTFLREIVGSPGILVSLNPTDERVEVDFAKDIPPLSKLEEVTVLSYSSSYNETEFMKKNAKKKASNVPLSPKSTLVLLYVPPKD